MSRKKEQIEGNIKATMHSIKVYEESPYKDKERDKQTRKDLQDSLKELKQELKDVNQHKWKGEMK